MWMCSYSKHLVSSSVFFVLLFLGPRFLSSLLLLSAWSWGFECADLLGGTTFILPWSGDVTQRAAMSTRFIDRGHIGGRPTPDGPESLSFRNHRSPVHYRIWISSWWYVPFVISLFPCFLFPPLLFHWCNPSGKYYIWFTNKSGKKLFIYFPCKQETVCVTYFTL